MPILILYVFLFSSYGYESVGDGRTDGGVKRVTRTIGRSHNKVHISLKINQTNNSERFIMNRGILTSSSEHKLRDTLTASFTDYKEKLFLGFKTWL